MLNSSEHISISQLKDHVDKEVIIKGWLYNIRSSGKLMFPELRDGTGLVQGVVLKKVVSEKTWEDLKSLPQESSLAVKGQVTNHPKKQGVYELQISEVEIIHQAEPYPITPKEHGIEFLIGNRHLWLRSKRQWAIMRVRHQVISAIQDFFNSRGFIRMDSPILTPAACEGTTTLFETPYFDLGKAYLSQSGQLYGEASAMAHGKIYVFGPTFRAEKSKTRRHLTEFWMVEPEMAFYDLDMTMDLAETFIEYIVGRVLENCMQELDILERNTKPLEAVVRPFPRITYDKAAELLAQKSADFSYGNDFGAPDETTIAAEFTKPVMVHRYPAGIKAFYMKRDPQNSNLSLSVDMLAPEGYGEIIGGAQREDDLDILLERLNEHQLPKEAFEWYLDLRRYGSVPHAGFGLGLERTLAWICGLEHIRETAPYPRMIYRITP
jgi:asparaginyl-tRNA synthetase